MAPLSGLSGSSRVLAADPVVGAPKKPRLNCAATPVHSLQSAEEKERSKWADRLRIIAGKAGAHAEINRCVLGGDASARDERALRSLVFQTGAFRTIRQNVLVWEKMERWALDHSCTVYPLTTEVFTRYCVWLENQSCGPAVIPALTYAVRGLQEVGDGSARCEVTSGWGLDRKGLYRPRQGAQGSAARSDAGGASSRASCGSPDQ